MDSLNSSYSHIISLGDSVSARNLSNVDLPLPFSPTMAVKDEMYSPQKSEGRVFLFQLIILSRLDYNLFYNWSRNETLYS